jgi:hypothetical protein
MANNYFTGYNPFDTFSSKGKMKTPMAQKSPTRNALATTYGAQNDDTLSLQNAYDAAVRRNTAAPAADVAAQQRLAAAYNEASNALAMPAARPPTVAGEVNTHPSITDIAAWGKEQERMQLDYANVMRQQQEQQTAAAQERQEQIAAMQNQLELAERNRRTAIEREMFRTTLQTAPHSVLADMWKSLSAEGSENLGIEDLQDMAEIQNYFANITKRPTEKVVTDDVDAEGNKIENSRVTRERPVADWSQPYSLDDYLNEKPQKDVEAAKKTAKEDDATILNYPLAHWKAKASKMTAEQKSAFKLITGIDL